MNIQRLLPVVVGAALAGAMSACVVQPAYQPVYREAPPPPPAPAVVAESAPVQVAPPALPVYDQPPPPADGYLWTPGYWAWGAGGYYWVPGTWVMPPQVGVVWTPGYWAVGAVAGVFIFHEGYWGPHVGFYGGINYGHGYGGEGFAGGRWEGNHYRYNAEVTNVTNVTNVTVYHETVVNNTTINNTTINNTTINNRASFSGPGGARAVPTAAERQAEQERHVAPTPEQAQHRSGAAANPALFAAHNQGHPPVAATPRPSAFTAHEAVPAHGASPQAIQEMHAAPAYHAPASAPAAAPHPAPPPPAPAPATQYHAAPPPAPAAQYHAAPPPAPTAQSHAAPPPAAPPKPAAQPKPAEKDKDHHHDEPR